MTAGAVRAAMLAMLVASAGCTEPVSSSHPDTSLFTRDGGPDANDGLDAGFPTPVTDTCLSPGGTIGRACLSTAECQDGCFCNGAESCTAGHCAAGALACTDTIGCTTDACLEEADRCVHVPDHGMCGDGVACNGYELCDLARGCTSAPPLVCNDESACTLDSCDDAVGCVFTGRDLDGDGAVASTCGGNDCDDYAADVLPGATEICDNRRDDDCDGLRDYADPSCVPTNETCAEATFVPLGGAGATVSGSTTGLRGDYTLSCGVPGADAVFRFTLMEAHDVRVTVSGATGISFALRPFDQCAAGPDTRCVSASPAVLDQRSLAAGTWALIVRMPHAGTFDLRIDLSAPSASPAVDRCDASTVDVGAGGTFTGRFDDTHDDYTLGCHTTSSTDAAYRFTIPAGDARDVTVTGATMTGTATGPVFLALTGDCATAASAMRCVTASATSLVQRSLGPGTYYLLLEPADAMATQWSMTVTFTDPPTPRNAGDACATAFDVTPTGTTAMASVLLSSLEYDTGTSCGAATGTRDGYFHFALSAPHDVTITTTTGSSHVAALSTACGVVTSELRCRTGASPLTQTFHSLPIGDYWITAQTSASSGTLTASVTLAPPTTAPANDVCAGAIALAVPIDVRPRDTLIAFADDLRGGVCTPTGLLDAFYVFTLGSPMSVTLDASTVPIGASDVWLTLRGVCGAGADLGCGTGHGAAHVATTSALAAGTYYVFVEMREPEASDFRLQFAAFP
jgi:hypothetical protein